MTISARTTVAQLAEEYLSSRRGLKESTLRQYRDIIDGRIVPALGKTAVQGLTPRDINAFYARLEETPALTRRTRPGGVNLGQ